MVFKPFSHIARQSFTKPLVHGYAQSLVAASQSSHASSTTQFGPFGNHPSSRFGKAGTSQLRDAFQNSSNVSSTSAKATSASSGSDTNGDGGLDAYYAAWQKHQRNEEENEWKQFQFRKRIGWKVPSAAFEGKGKEKEDVTLRSDALRTRGGLGLERAYSTSAVDDLKKLDGNEGEAAAIAIIDDVVIQEKADVRTFPNGDSQLTTTPIVVVGESREEAIRDVKPQAFTGLQTTPPHQTTTIDLPHHATTNSYADQIAELHETKRYADVPPVFEAMIRANILPTTTSYNALLNAAIVLPAAKHQSVQKALVVYTNMLQQNVQPDTKTYTMLLEVLSRRSLEVSEMKTILEQTRLRYGSMKEPGQFMFGTHQTEYEIAMEDTAFEAAMKLFKLSTTGLQMHAFTTETYRLLLNACAANGEVEDMIRIYAHMEGQQVIPHAAVYPPMIKAFAASGDLRSAVECYDEYKRLAIADDSGSFKIVQRVDSEVYAAVVKAYAMCGKKAGAERFFMKIVESFSGYESRAEALQKIKDTVVVTALVQQHLDSGNFKDALKVAEQTLSHRTLNQALSKICITAADMNDSKVAEESHQKVSSIENYPSASIALLAMYVRHGQVDKAQGIWSTVSAILKPTGDFIEPTAMYAVALIGSGNVDNGLMQARLAFNRIRSSETESKIQTDVTDQIDQAIEFIGAFLVEKNIIPSPQASMSFMWAMIENGGLLAPVAERLLASVGPAQISTLSLDDLKLALQVEAGFVGTSQNLLDIAHSTRFAHLLRASLANHMPLDTRTSSLVDNSVSQIIHQYPDLVAEWHRSKVPTYTQHSPVSFDPYASSVDHRGSDIIIRELETQGTKHGNGMNDALATFRNIRRAGKHPRYTAYAKLISAAARDGRSNLVYDLLAMARHDMPIVPEYSVVRHGWASILDSAIGAYLTVGNRKKAEELHQELMSIGAAPSANTFGLYITTLKESTKTFDEATEAVKIFQRAKMEGVEPSSFLYNALIGKLGKARRIDDCLFYFKEMRELNIKPTSVTYGTIVNALCRVSDDRFAQELFEEMELMDNYKPRPAPYNSLMQFFLTTKRDSNKVLEYYNRMLSKRIVPTMHTYKLLIDTYATLEPVNMAAAEGVLETIRQTGQRPQDVHYASLIHAKGCTLHDMAGARKVFDEVIASSSSRPQACLYQALFESMVANHCVQDTENILADMSARRVDMTAYIANTLIHGWAAEGNITKSKSVYDHLGKEKREPSTYEGMTRAYLVEGDRDGASEVVCEMVSRGYPAAVSGKILDLLGHGMSRTGSVAPSN